MKRGRSTWTKVLPLEVLLSPFRHLRTQSFESEFFEPISVYEHERKRERVTIFEIDSSKWEIDNRLILFFPKSILLEPFDMQDQELGQPFEFVPPQHEFRFARTAVGLDLFARRNSVVFRQECRHGSLRDNVVLQMRLKQRSWREVERQEQEWSLDSFNV